jgi:hypothetical protein
MPRLAMEVLLLEEITAEIFLFAPGQESIS